MESYGIEIYNNISLIKRVGEVCQHYYKGYNFRKNEFATKEVV